MTAVMNVESRARIHAALGDPHRLRVVDELALGDRTPRELADDLGIGTNLLAHHLDVLAGEGVVTRRVADDDRRRRYIVLRHEALAGLRPRPRVEAGEVLFVCTRNSARSPLAAALWRERTGRAAESAGASPAVGIHPLAVRAAAELGVELVGVVPRGLGEVTRRPSLVVSVCDRARAAGDPFDVPHLHWSVPDPVEEGTTGAFQAAFAEIARRIDVLAGAAA